MNAKHTAPRQKTVGLLWTILVWGIDMVTRSIGRIKSLHRGDESITFSFLAHRVETWNRVLDYQHCEFLHEDPHRHVLISGWLRGWCNLMSFYDLVRLDPIDVVDSYEVHTDEGMMRGHTVLLRNYGWHFTFLKGLYALTVIRLRLVYAVLYAQNVLGSSIIGLGALTKDVTLTEGGKWLVRTLGPKLESTLVHGDTFTAAAMIANMKKLVADQLVDVGRAVVVGSTSKVGTPLCLELVAQGWKVIAVTKSEERFQTLRDKLPEELRHRMSRVTSLQDVDANGLGLVVTLKASPFGPKMVEALNRLNVNGNLMVVNGAVPDPCTIPALKRATYRHMDGGLVGFNTGKVGMRFMMRLARRPSQQLGWMYACWAGTALWSLMRLQGFDVKHEVDMVDLERANMLWVKGTEGLGFHAPPYTSHLRSVSWDPSLTTEELVRSPMAGRGPITPPDGVPVEGERSFTAEVNAFKAGS